MLSLMHSRPKDLVHTIYGSTAELVKLPAVRRLQDDWGSGGYGDSRAGGTRIHKGIDYLLPAGSVIYSPVSGRVTKHGLCYRGDEYHYTQITDLQGNRVRLFYTEPCIAVGEEIMIGDAICYAQELGIRYHAVRNDRGDILKEPMQNHCHLEILLGSTGKESTDPDQYSFS